MTHLYPHAFSQFDPLTGTVPTYFEGEFQEIADRARELLAARSGDEIKAAHRAIRLHLEEQKFEGFRELNKLPEGSIAVSPASVVFELFGLLHKINLTSEYDLAGATWPEYFAVLALGLIGHARALTSDDRNYSRYRGTEIELNRQREAGEFAIWATEAITIGAMLQKNFPVIPAATEIRITGKIIRRETKMNNRIQAREAANKRHSESDYAPLKMRVTELFADLIQEIPDISNAKASKVIWSQLSPSEKVIFEETEEPERTVEKWLGPIKKKLETGK